VSVGDAPVPGLCEHRPRAFPLVHPARLRFDLAVVRKPPACRAGEASFMWAPVGRGRAAPVLRRRVFPEAALTIQGAWPPDLRPDADVRTGKHSASSNRALTSTAFWAPG